MPQDDPTAFEAAALRLGGTKRDTQNGVRSFCFSTALSFANLVALHRALVDTEPSMALAFGVIDGKLLASARKKPKTAENRKRPREDDAEDDDAKKTRADDADDGVAAAVAGLKLPAPLAARTTTLLRSVLRLRGTQREKVVCGWGVDQRERTSSAAPRRVLICRFPAGVAVDVQDFSATLAGAFKDGLVQVDDDSVSRGAAGEALGAIPRSPGVLDAARRGQPCGVFFCALEEPGGS